MLFFKKKTEIKKQAKTSSKPSTTPTKEKPKLLNENFLDDRLYEFSKKLRKLTQDEASASLLARQLSRLVKSDKF